VCLVSTFQNSSKVSDLSQKKRQFQIQGEVLFVDPIEVFVGLGLEKLCLVGHNKKGEKFHISQP